MTTTSSVGNDNSALNSALAGGSASAADIQNNFLKMLVTQMNNQDPLNPMDNSQLTSQLAQISTVSSLQNVNSTLNALLSQTAASRAMDSANLIGRTVLVPGSAVSVDGGVPGRIAVDIPSTADTVQVQVLDATGNVVRTIDMKGQTAGVHDIAWDGKNDQGGMVADGDYKFKVTATAGGKDVSPVALVTGKVQGISGDSTGVLVNLEDGTTANVDDVRRIS
ncbi:flagellar hook assembly protein FlgD [Cupriavidus plantarum]|uniref:Basal-body rod modification protein FlgD n=1 Tax=Cupriavidus plantarum TaxID=942865 RepID=A0A316EK07_9BURK|nr:flagellar hook assembly protein FlgD [Cupriavidus plantarum]NYI02435.1 flagellar basal-body rod modification protein FlgD [Cupriavidus plantarum]PWK31640.1 flagellar basal-body rod modification protein FlgD [Cupriavidus plantarum]REE85418.1 flagellar basal-body rod modification protein FlgD [Cupriavidus plantarum]RLK28710.1 flagellar basal-body rod modification protein FlgD [Cupriavidus plantarum]CAG2145614.1 Basal-body rod modification protein FlgD [Cupriavidus plantarum]